MSLLTQLPSLSINSSISTFSILLVFIHLSMLFPILLLLSLSSHLLVISLSDALSRCPPISLSLSL
ncbi:hypothetical protein Syun_006917 [Stephania yunnanensis]|uniref:Uncharacterized protein n=1 Tax=Stephania yunnanensis TaxID=152371 RepID=A0AAP0KXS7_9MAGN